MIGVAVLVGFAAFVVGWFAREIAERHAHARRRGGLIDIARSQPRTTRDRTPW